MTSVWFHVISVCNIQLCLFVFWIHMHRSMLIDQTWTVGIYHSATHTLEIQSLAVPTARLAASKPSHPVFICLALELHVYEGDTPSSAVDLNSAPHTCTVSSLGHWSISPILLHLIFPSTHSCPILQVRKLRLRHFLTLTQLEIREVKVSNLGSLPSAK